MATHGTIEAVKGPKGQVFELRVKEGTERMVALLRAAGYECTTPTTT